MFHGRFFSSADARLEPHVRALEADLARELPDFFNGIAASRVVIRPDEPTGRGVFVAAGATLTAGDAVGLYFGDLVEEVPLGDFILGLGAVRRSHHTFHLSVDASRCCTGEDGPAPSPLNAALYNHACHDCTVKLHRPKGVTFPCAVAYAAVDLVEGDRLLWDYDGGRPSDCFTVGAAERAHLQAAGAAFVPCLCRGTLPCPRQRWFRIFPAT